LTWFSVWPGFGRFDLIFSVWLDFFGLAQVFPVFFVWVWFGLVWFGFFGFRLIKLKPNRSVFFKF